MSCCLPQTRAQNRLAWTPDIQLGRSESVLNESQRGDPQGSRIADRKKAAFSEASRLLALAESQLSKVDITGIGFEVIRNELAALEKSVTGSGSRVVEGRKTYPRKRHQSRSVGQVPKRFLFIDEAGRAEQSLSKRGDDWFALGAVSMTGEAVDRYIQEADYIKTMFLSDSAVTFHEPEMRQRTLMFHFGGDCRKQEQFDEALAALISNSEFTAFGVGIRKGSLSTLRNRNVGDPYLPLEVYDLGLHLLVERYVHYLAYNPARLRASIVMESQEAHPDALHQLTVSETIAQGTQWVSPKGFQRYLNPGVEFVRKRGSHPTELADMLTRDIFEWIRTDCASEPLRWDLFGEKFYRRGDLQRGKFGLKVFPDSDIRDAVEAHRARAKN